MVKVGFRWACSTAAEERGGGDIYLSSCDTSSVGFPQPTDLLKQVLPLTFMPVLSVLLGNVSL